MSNLLTTTVKWFGGKLALYLIILCLLILVSAIKIGFNQDESLRTERSSLEELQSEIRKFAANTAAESKKLIEEKHELRISERRRIKRNHPLMRNIPGTDPWLRITVLNAEIKVIEKLLFNYRAVEQWAEELQILQSKLVSIQEAIAQTKRQLESLEQRRDDILHGNEDNKKRKQKKYSKLIDANQSKLNQQLAEHTQLRSEIDAKQAQNFPSRIALVDKVIVEILSPIQERIDTLKQQMDGNWLSRIRDSVEKFWKQALLFFVAAVLVPSWWTVFAYYGVAPLASRRFHIQLLKPSKLEDKNSVSLDDVCGLASAASLQLVLGEREHLLVRPEFLQGTPMMSAKRTVWLYDWSRPIMSLASNLHAMTRIAAAGTESIDLHCGTDASARLATLPLFDGCPMVMRPRSVIGVVERPDHPIRITTVWRLFSLSGWLTFQLRYVVFHGPGSLILQGCNGVCIGRADSGRAVNQAATLGFSAQLSYSVTRCETFGAYFTGAQQLFNDRFDGKGIYLYEVTPRNHAGGSSRGGMQNLIDAALRIFGI